MQLWISVKEAAPIIGRTPKGIYDAIAEKRFPFQFRRSGRAIFISARDLGLITDNANEKTREGDQSFDAAAPAHA